MNSDYSDKKIMTLFKSKHHRRILKKIAELEDKRADLVLEKEKVKQSLSPSEFAKYYVRIGDMAHDINLLKSLL